MPHERRYGRFKISRAFWEAYPIVCRRVMGTVFITHAECMYASDAFEYVAWCEQFDVIPAGEEIPSYTACIHEGGAYITWRRVE